MEKDKNEPSSWAKVPVEDAIKQGITDGSNLKKSPTKEEVITLIMRATGLAPKLEK